MMSLTTFTTQRQLTQKNMPASALEGPMAQQQKMLLYVLPLVFAFTGVNFPIGVLIYWTTTNLWSMGQQFYVIRRNPTPGSEAERQLKERRARKAAAKGIVLEDEKPAIEDKSRGQREQPKRKDRARPSTRPGGSEGAPGLDEESAPGRPAAAGSRPAGSTGRTKPRAAGTPSASDAEAPRKPRRRPVEGGESGATTDRPERSASARSKPSIEGDRAGAPRKPRRKPADDVKGAAPGSTGEGRRPRSSKPVSDDASERPAGKKRPKPASGGSARDGASGAEAPRDGSGPETTD